MPFHFLIGLSTFNFLLHALLLSLLLLQQLKILLFEGYNKWKEAAMMATEQAASEGTEIFGRVQGTAAHEGGGGNGGGGRAADVNGRGIMALERGCRGQTQGRQGEGQGGRGRGCKTEGRGGDSEEEG